MFIAPQLYALMRLSNANMIGSLYNEFDIYTSWGCDSSGEHCGHYINLDALAFLAILQNQGGKDPCAPAYRIGIPVTAQLEMAKANNGIAIGSIDFSNGGPANGVSLNFFNKFSQNGATVPRFTTISVSYGGPQVGLSIGATNSVSLPTGSPFASASADLVQFNDGKVFNVNGSVSILGLPVQVWTGNNPQLGLPPLSSSEMLKNAMNANQDLLGYLNQLVTAFGKCREKK